MSFRNIHSKRKALIMTLIIWLMVFSVVEILLSVQLSNIADNERRELTDDYVEVQELFSSVLSDYTSSLKGVGAYIQMNDNVDNEEISKLLELLIGDRRNEFVNVGILKDTTITWVFPLIGNEGAIGVDLSKVPGQDVQVAYVKENLKEMLVGPVDLVQGGTGFIIRIPIVKNNVYWGMTSFVLKTEVVYNYFENFEKNHKVNILVRYNENDKKTIYGNIDILDNKPLLYSNNSAARAWEIHLVPSKGWFDSYKHFYLISLIGLIVSGYFAWRLYKLLIRISRLEKNNIDMIAKSTRDAFTGIFNRGYFDMKGKEEILTADRFKTALTMIYFDIDHFKSINDDFGHSKGDKVLLEVTKAIKGILRMNDFFARWGGDEFVILLPNTELKGANLVAEKIRTTINNLNIQEDIKLTASIGVAERVSYEFYESWFARVDKALYKAKEDGRDQVKLSDHKNIDNVNLKIIWQKEWNCGESLIDNQHKKMVELSNEVVQSAFDIANYDETIRKANLLLLMVKKHFIDEIEYLKAVNYSKVEEHALLHIKLNKDLKVKYDGLVNKTLDSTSLLKYLHDELIYNHFVKTDEDYRMFISSK